MRTFRHLIFAIPLVLVACGYPYRDRDTWEYEEPQKKIFVPTTEQAYKSLDVPIYFWNLTLKFETTSPRFWMYTANMASLMSDTIRSWRVFGEYEWSGDSQESAKQHVLYLFDEPDNLATWTYVKTPFEVDLLYMYLAGAPLGPLFYLNDIHEGKKLSVEVKKDVQYRSVYSLSRQLRRNIDRPDGVEQACVYLGYLAREAEKRKESTEEYWELCQETGSTRHRIVEFLDRKGW